LPSLEGEGDEGAGGADGAPMRQYPSALQAFAAVGGAGGAVSPVQMLKKGSAQSEALSSRGRSPVAKLRR